MQKTRPSAGDTDNHQSQALATALIQAAAPGPGESCNWAALEKPIVLEPYSEYYLASYEDNHQATNKEQYMLTGTGTALGGGLFTVDGNTWNFVNGEWSSMSGQQCANVNLKIQ